ncbi:MULTISPECIES: M28 family peptidase [unclassified Variovorax]|uniref:M28 family peptidase n=1 Tax=unclassified Variovorax TaxID=663243 RepID=UPI0008C44883|nr:MULTISPECIES: M28 family peptidase [unclassified Variovorax]SEJ49323.1 PA domain-containing protein [Variovorax sp. OK202]SFC50928.1 PA domain-containing protein [Variovorax sp. OK212]
MIESPSDLQTWLSHAEADPTLMEDFQAICGFGGRLAGTPAEARAQDWALERMRATDGRATRVEVPYDGWSCELSALELLDGSGQVSAVLRCQALLRSANSPDGGLEGEVLDLGEGRSEDFARAGERLHGRIALVRHEYPFSSGHLHRRRKYDMAVQAGAIGFLIANPLPGGGPLSGSSGRPVNGFGIPAAYIGDADRNAIAQAGAYGPVHVRIRIKGEERLDSRAAITVLDIPGRSGQRVVLSAHLDGHDLGASALDNASGVAVVLAAARALTPRISQADHGLRVCLFSAEEWALAGSARYLGGMDPSERATLALNINLDTVAGDDRLTALISDYPELAALIAEASAYSGVPVDCHLPLMPNSDHASFAHHGIPALRLVAGFERPESRVRHILSADDQPGVVREDELRRALRFTVAMSWHALNREI